MDKDIVPVFVAFATFLDNHTELPTEFSVLTFENYFPGPAVSAIISGSDDTEMMRHALVWAEALDCTISYGEPRRKTDGTWHRRISARGCVDGLRIEVNAYIACEVSVVVPQLALVG
jgi:hypothetical protein